MLRMMPTMLFVATALTAMDFAAAQVPRNRTLSYDVAKKDWVEDAPPTPGSAEAELHEIKLAITATNYDKAFAQTKAVIRELGEDHRLYPDLLIARAEAQIGRKRFVKAHLALQEFLSKFSGMPQTAEALRLEFVIAESYLKGERRRWMGLRLLSGKDAAIQILDEISSNHPDSPLAELAIKVTADYMFDSGDHKLAEGEYARLLREYPRSRYTEHAMSRSAEAALASYGGVAYDEAQLIEAEERFEDLRRYSAEVAARKDVGAVLDSIRESRAEKDLSIASHYDKTEHFSSAVYYYRLVLQDWPGSIASVRATERLRLLGAAKTRVKTGAAGP